MANVITAPTYDPITTAQALAQKSIAAAQQQITDKSTAASATAKALSSLGSAISAFQSSLSSLAGLGKSVLAQSATLSGTGIGTATAQPSAAAGTYSLFVKQLATASQVSYTVGDGVVPRAGSQFTVKLAAPDSTDPTTPGASASASFEVDLGSAADTDKDGKLSAREIAAAINSAPKNSGLVSAGVVTLNGETRLVLTSGKTGEANTVWIDTAAADSTLKSALGARAVVTQARDAIINFGGSTGTEIRQASNTFTNIDGVSMTFTQAQAEGADPITLTVANNLSGTTANVQAFVDAYNKLKSAVDALVAPGDPVSSTAAGAFAHDAGVRGLQTNLVNLLRSTGAATLASYGITAARNGTLTLDTARLSKQIAAAPSGLAALIGSASSSNPSGISGALNTYLNQWSNSSAGQIKQRTDANTKAQADLTKRQDTLDAQYNTAYDRYLKQFTELQTLQSTMNSNVSIFDALFGSDDSK